MNVSNLALNTKTNDELYIHVTLQKCLHKSLLCKARHFCLFASFYVNNICLFENATTSKKAHLSSVLCYVMLTPVILSDINKFP